MSQYFTEQTDVYIKDFLESDVPEIKHKLFNEGIKPAFEKLIENLIYVYKFFNLGEDIETLKRDCLANLYQMLPKFKPDKGKKGFSYFNVVARNWFIQKARERTKKNRIEREIHVDIDRDSVKNNEALSYSSHESSVLEKEFWLSMYREFDFWRDKLQKKNEKKLLEAVIFLLTNPELVSIYNKKAVYLYLREMTGLNEKQVAMNLKKLRELYEKFKNDYHSSMTP